MLISHTLLSRSSYILHPSPFIHPSPFFLPSPFILHPAGTPHFSLEGPGGHDRGVNCLDYYPGGDKPYLLSGTITITIMIMITNYLDDLAHLYPHPQLHPYLHLQFTNHSYTYTFTNYKLALTAMPDTYRTYTPYDLYVFLQYMYPLTPPPHFIYIPTDNTTTTSMTPTGADDRTVKIWDYQTKACLQTLEGHSHNVSSVCFHPRLPLVISASEDGTVRLWHSTTYRPETTLNYGLERAWCLAPTKDANKLAIGYDEGRSSPPPLPPSLPSSLPPPPHTQALPLSLPPFPASYTRPHTPFQTPSTTPSNPFSSPSLSLSPNPLHMV